MVLSELHLELSELYEILECLIYNHNDRASNKEIEERAEEIGKIEKRINYIKKLAI